VVVVVGAAVVVVTDARVVVVTAALVVETVAGSAGVRYFVQGIEQIG
jgi:hypothetical protein